MRSTPTAGAASGWRATVRVLHHGLPDAAEAIVDAYDEEEQVTGFFSILEEELAVPFETTVLGVAVTVEGIGLASYGITATCVRGKHRQAIPVLDLPLPEPPPAGWKWIAAYRHWAR